MTNINEYFAVRMYGTEWIFVAEESGGIYVTVVNDETPSGGNGGYLLPNGDRQTEYSRDCVHCSDEETFNAACLNWLDEYTQNFRSNN